MQMKKVNERERRTRNIFKKDEKKKGRIGGE